MQRPSVDPVTVVANYPGSGIGDFGRRLVAHLHSSGLATDVIETHPESGGRQQRRSITAGTGPIVANLGLTAWGRSGYRNLLGFRAVGHRARRSPRAVAIVHHAIEQFGGPDAGFPVHPWTRWGAHRALDYLRPCRTVTFSPVLAALLERQYGWPAPYTVPLPCEVAQRPASGFTPRVVTAGYLAPYKGIDLFLEAASLSPTPAAWTLVGQPHRLLSSAGGMSVTLDRWTARSRELGVTMTGYLGDAELSRALGEGSVGVLCYTSSSGASASFSLFAERGIPVVATDLPEFRYLLISGAGVVLVPPEPAAVRDAVERLREHPAEWRRLSEHQLSFAARNSWPTFASTLRAYFENGTWPISPAPSDPDARRVADSPVSGTAGLA